MTNLLRRVESLEDGQGPCPWCGHDTDARVRYAVVWETEEGAPKESSPPCGYCGNQSTVVVDWLDTPRSFEQAKPKAEQDVPDYPPSFASWDEGGG